MIGSKLMSITKPMPAIKTGPLLISKLMLLQNQNSTSILTSSSEEERCEISREVT
jgi:hypothetical protein